MTNALTASPPVFVHKDVHQELLLSSMTRQSLVFNGIASIIVNLPTARSHKMDKWFIGPPDIYSAHISEADRILYFRNSNVFIIGIGDYHGEKGKIFRQQITSRLQYVQSLTGNKASSEIEDILSNKKIFVPWQRRQKYLPLGKKSFF